MRLFFAVELPPELHRRLAAGLASLRASLPPARWVRAEGLHTTRSSIHVHGAVNAFDKVSASLRFKADGNGGHL